jgi:YNFM family putative membrane transporter
MSETSDSSLIEAGTADFRRINIAMFAGGFATFAMLYATQPILPRLAEEFSIAPTTVSLSVSGGTAALAAMLIPASVLSDRFGRQPLMRGALILAAAVALACAFVADFNQLLFLRIVLGAVLAGLPAAAIAYLGEEVAPSAQGRAMGLYIAGNAMGGMSGRFLVATLTDLSSWRVALVVLGVIGALSAAIFWYCLPSSRQFSVRRISPSRIAADAVALFSDKTSRWLFLTAFLMMGAFTSVYNYLGFRLHAAPFSLGQTAIGAIFLLYLLGTFSSAWTGGLVDRVGRSKVLWAMILLCSAGLMVTLSHSLPVLIAGVACFTFGYFGVHTTASGWVTRRAAGRRALAAALYLCSYYLGASIIGTASGFAWEAFAWPGVVAALGLSIAPAVFGAWQLRKPGAEVVPVELAPKTAL